MDVGYVKKHLAILEHHFMSRLKNLQSRPRIIEPAYE